MKRAYSFFWSFGWSEGMDIWLFRWVPGFGPRKTKELQVEVVARNISSWVGIFCGLLRCKSFNALCKTLACSSVAFAKDAPLLQVHASEGQVTLFSVFCSSACGVLVSAINTDVPNPPGANPLVTERAFPTSDYWGHTKGARCAEEMTGICRDCQ